MRFFKISEITVAILMTFMAKDVRAFQPYCVNSCIVEGVDAAVDLAGGYRYDKMTSTVKVYNPVDTFLFSDNLHARNLNVYEVGLNGRIIVCRDWFVRLYGTLGRITKGSYLETVQGIAKKSRSNAGVHNGITRDFSAGGGYLFPCTYWLGIGPVGGWSYHEQRIRLGKAKTDGVCDPVLQGLTYKNRWQGPWIGIEAQCLLCNAWLELGYEYHWSHWHASWSLKGPDIPGVAFSDRRKSNGAFGNVVFFKGTHQIGDMWEVGLEVKLQYWRVSSGKIKPRACDTLALEIPPAQVEKVSGAAWHSYEGMVMVGYHF